jgi:phosphatidylinositol glycan class S
MSTLSFQQPGVRQVIFLSYWLVVFVALRLWWSTTSIERLSLPESRVQNQATRTVRRIRPCWAQLAHVLSQLHLPIDIKLEGDWSEHQRTEFSKEIQTLQANAGVSGQSLGIRVSTAASTGAYQFVSSILVSDSTAVKTLHLLTSLPLGKAILPHPCKAGPLSHLLVRILSFIARPTLERIAESSAEWAHLVSELLALESKVAEDHTTFKHSPRYRLAFSLLNEDAAAGGAITEWPAEAFVARKCVYLAHHAFCSHSFRLYHPDMRSAVRPAQLYSREPTPLPRSLGL